MGECDKNIKYNFSVQFLIQIMLSEKCSQFLKLKGIFNLVAKFSIVKNFRQLTLFFRKNYKSPAEEKLILYNFLRKLPFSNSDNDQKSETWQKDMTLAIFLGHPTSLIIRLTLFNICYILTI